jgi:hypothetical protein
VTYFLKACILYTVWYFFEKHLRRFVFRVYQTLCGLPNIGTILPDLSKRYQMDSFLKVLIFHLVKKSMDEEGGKETELLNLLKDVDVIETTRTEVIG